MVGFLSIMLFGTGLVRADTIIFHNNDATLSTQDSSLASEPLVAIKAINTVTIDRMGVLGDFTGSDGGLLRFVIFAETGGISGTKTPLYDSGLVAFADDGDGLSWKDSPTFSFTLVAGSVYDIGAFSSVVMLQPQESTPETQGGLTSAVNAGASQNRNFSVTNFLTTPIYDARANGGNNDVNIRLFAADPPVGTPLPSTALAGIVLIAGLAVGRRRRRGIRHDDSRSRDQA
jgi:hypothetical protein